MDVPYFQHPRRFPKNAEGPFYTIGYRTRENESPSAQLVWCADCLQCEAPEAEAPELLAPLNGQNHDTYFVQQPSTPEELSKACMAARVCCVAALRYGGRDISVIKQLQNDPEYCDYVIGDDGQLMETVDTNGNYLPFAQKIIDRRRAKWNRERRRRNKKWWQFWIW